MVLSFMSHAVENGLGRGRQMGEKKTKGKWVRHLRLVQNKVATGRDTLQN